MKETIKELDITGVIVDGKVSSIIRILQVLMEIGFDRLHVDGYEPLFSLYKSSEIRE